MGRQGQGNRCGSGRAVVRRGVGLLMVIALILAAMALSSPAAFAAKGAVSIFGGRGTQGGQFGQAQELAINQAGTGGAGAGDVYVVDGGKGGNGEGNERVQEFSPTGEFIRAFGLGVGGAGVDVCTVASACGKATRSEAAGGMREAHGIAIDQASGAVYVSDLNNARIDVFSATGEFEGAFGWNVRVSGGAEELQFCTVATGCKAGSSGSKAGEIVDLSVENTAVGGLDVNPANGHVVVADPSNRRVDEFAPTLVAGVVTGVSFVRAYGWGAKNGAPEFQICTSTCHAPAATGAGLGQFANRSPVDLSVDAGGRVFVADYKNDRLQTFDSEGNPLGTFGAGALATTTEPESVTVDRANGKVFVVVTCTGPSAGCSAERRRILEVDSAGTLINTYFQGADSSIGSVAVDDATETPYYATESKVIIAGTVVPPGAELEAVTAFDLTPGGITAHLAGKVDPGGLETEYHFEYSADGASWTKVPVPDGTVPGDETVHSVSQLAEGLTALTEYKLRLVATKILNSGSATAESSFTTPASPPLVSGTTYSNVSDTGARLEALVNPENQASSYSFQYVTESQFQESGFAGAVSVPAPPAPAGSGASYLPVAQQVEGLVPRTTYRFRLVASNPTGTTEGERDSAAEEIPHAFTTFATTGLGLPDGRAYEQASPLDKNGSNIQAGTNAVQAAAAGDAITFFSNAGIPGGEGAQFFPIFLATRSSSPAGWSTQGLLPPASTGSVASVLGWSEDLKSAFASAHEPGALATLYIRDTSSHTVNVIASGLHGRAPGNPEPVYAASTGGTSPEVLFEDTAELLPAAVTGKSNVYLWDGSTGALAVAGVLNNGQAPPGGAIAGSFDWFLERNTSFGGAAKGYFTQAQHVLSPGASRVFFTAGGTGQLYVRDNPLQEQSPLDAEGSCTDGSLGCTIQISESQRSTPDPNGARPAAFLGATPDGSVAFFTSCEKLTDDSTARSTASPTCQEQAKEAEEHKPAPGNDLYAYRLATSELTDLTVDSVDLGGAEVQGLVGTSDDGSYVYFVANGALASGATTGDCTQTSGACNLYVSHEGSIALISSVGAAGNLGQSDVANWIPTAALPGEFTEKSSRVDAGGKLLLFRSRLPLTGYDNEGKAELYRSEYSAGAVALQCISCVPTGVAPTGDASLQGVPEKTTAPHSAASVLTRNLAAGGDRVFFDTPDKLVAQDTNGVNDVYEWEAPNPADETDSCHGTAQNGGCLALVSTGTSPQPSYFGDASTSGNDVFLFTTQPLVAQDKDELQDVYDARIGGGIPSQQEVQAPPCQGEPCAGPPLGSPPTAAPGTPAFVGPGNPPHSVKCRKGQRKVKRKGKVVCAKAKHHRRHHRKHHPKHKKHHPGNKQQRTAQGGGR